VWIVRLAYQWSEPNLECSFRDRTVTHVLDSYTVNV
jgi:hypothetical protein